MDLSQLKLEGSIPAPEPEVMQNAETLRASGDDPRVRAICDALIKANDSIQAVNRQMPFLSQLIQELGAEVERLRTASN